MFCLVCCNPCYCTFWWIAHSEGKLKTLHNVRPKWIRRLGEILDVLRRPANILCRINKSLILSFYSFSFIVLSNRSNRRTDQLREWARILWWKMGLGGTQAADSLIQPSSAKVSPLDCRLILRQKSELVKKEMHNCSRRDNGAFAVFNNYFSFYRSLRVT